MAPISFVKAELQKQEKELQAFRNDVNRHNSEFDSTSFSGNTFVDACDVDKDDVKEDLAAETKQPKVIAKFFDEEG